LGLGDAQFVDLVEIVDLQGLDCSVGVLLQDEQIQHPDQLGVH
jgi:hypothetical protein